MNLVVITTKEYGMHLEDARATADALLEELQERMDFVAAAGLDRWQDEKRVVRIGPAAGVLRDPQLRSAIERIVRVGRKLGIVVQIFSWSPPRTLEDFGGSAVLRNMIAMQEGRPDRFVSYDVVDRQDLPALFDH